jgi:phosphoenolpyruvate synthase/pyruvate phosphate dikinase
MLYQCCLPYTWIFRAKTFRSVNHISPNSVGMAVIIQSMVYGNMNAESCSGVGYSRHPGTGENVVYGEFLPDSEGLEYLHSSKIHSLQVR